MTWRAVACIWFGIAIAIRVIDWFPALLTDYGSAAFVFSLCAAVLCFLLSVSGKGRSPHPQGEDSSVSTDEPPPAQPDEKGP